MRGNARKAVGPTNVINPPLQLTKVGRNTQITVYNGRNINAKMYNELITQISHFLFFESRGRDQTL